MKTKVHAAASVIAFLTIATFFTSTVLVELLGSHESIATVKHYIFLGIFLLIPAMAITGISGGILASSRKGELIGKKKKRMPIIAGNGLIILTPCAIYLDNMAAAGDFSTVFYIIQGIELIAGATNLALMSKNLKDGLRLTGRIMNKPFTA